MIRLRSLVLACALAAALAGGMAPVARAQQMEPAVIAVVDIQRLLHESKSGQSIERQMDAMRQTFADGISQREAALRQEEKDLQDQAALLAPEVLAERRRLFEEKVVALQRDVRAQQQALEQSYGSGVDQVRQAIIEILSAMVDERGIGLVVPQTAVLVGTRNLDITDDVLARLDQRLPAVTLNTAGGN